MKTKIVLLIPVLICVTILECIAGSNLKFPDSHVNDWLLAGKDPEKYISGIDKSIQHDDKASAFVFSKNKNSNKWTTLMQMTKANSYEGKKIKLSAWIKSENLTEWVGLWMRVDKKKTYTAFDNMQDRPIKGSTDWKKYEVILYADTGAKNIAYGVLFQGDGKIWIDDVNLEVVNNDVIVTGYNTGLTESIVNAGFENIDTSGKPQNWYGTMSDGYTISSDKVVFHEGAASALLNTVEYKRKNKDGFGRIDGWMKPGTYAGKRVRMTGWIKTEDVKKAGMWMRVDGEAEGNVLSFDNMMNRAIKKTTDWNKYQIVLDVPSHAMNINFGALFTGKGKLWFDDVRFEIVANDIVSTSTYSSKPKELKREESSLRPSNYVLDTVKNLGFEE